MFDNPTVVLLPFPSVFSSSMFYLLFFLCLYKLNTRRNPNEMNKWNPKYLSVAGPFLCDGCLLFYPWENVPTEIRGIKFKFTIEQPEKSQNLSELFILAVLSQRAALGLLFTHHYKGLSPSLSALFRSAAVVSQCPGVCCSLDRWVRCHTPLPYSLQG